jgi:Uma2 family endonuclease
MVVTAPPQTYSLVQYRQLEETAEERHEYHNGRIIPMTGGTLEHAIIISNLIFLLRLACQDSPFQVYGGDLRIWIPEHQRGLYPDVSLFEGQPRLHDNRRDEVLNPYLLVEVLSGSTEAYKRGQKFRYYRSIPSLKDYLLVSQTEPLIECYQRTEANQWLLSTCQGLDTNFTFVNGDSISLTQVYQGVEFAE